MVNTINTLTERNKELLTKVEELENLRKNEISREAQLKIIDKIQNWNKENYEVGERLKKYEGNTYPSHIMDNITEDKPIWKSLAQHVNYELMMVQYLHEKENPLDELLEMMLNSITKNVVGYYSSRGLEEKKNKEYWELREKEKEAKEEKEKAVKEKEIYFKVSTDYYQETVEKRVENDELKEELKEKEVLIEKLEDLLEAEQEQFQLYQDKAVEYQKKRENKIKELEWELYLNNKTLPDLPQVKKESRIKVFKKKLVNKVNKVFHWQEQKQENQYIAQVEVKVN